MTPRTYDSPLMGSNIHISPGSYEDRLTDEQFEIWRVRQIAAERLQLARNKALHAVGWETSNTAIDFRTGTPKPVARHPVHAPDHWVSIEDAWRIHMSEVPHHRLRRYDFNLPGREPGDAFASLLFEGNSSREAFETLARRFEEAASMCHRMSAVAGDCSELTFDSCDSFIGVRGPLGHLDKHVTGGLLTVSDREWGDRGAATHVLTERVRETMAGKGYFSSLFLVQELAKIDEDLRGSNPAWVREVLDGLVGEGLVKHSEDLYEVEFLDPVRG